MIKVHKKIVTISAPSVEMDAKTASALWALVESIDSDEIEKLCWEDKGLVYAYWNDTDIRKLKELRDNDGQS
tara:strand:+ start:680 stop:895 length:216 start_codon:yes stop_codon:yes gene_type:complete